MSGPRHLLDNVLKPVRKATHAKDAAVRARPEPRPPLEVRTAGRHAREREARQLLSSVQLVIKLGEGDVTFVAGNSCFAFTREVSRALLKQLKIKSRRGRPSS